MSKDSSISFFNAGFAKQNNLAVGDLFPPKCKGGKNDVLQLKLPSQALIFNKPIRLPWSS